MPVVRPARRRSWTLAPPLASAGLEALRREGLRAALTSPACDRDAGVEQGRAAAEGVATVPPYNRWLSGHLAELRAPRERWREGQAGVICAVRGPGGIGKADLACTHAQAFAGACPGGRVLVRGAGLLAAEETDALAVVGPKLRLRATPRLLPPAAGHWLTLDEVAEDEASERLEKRPRVRGRDGPADRPAPGRVRAGGRAGRRVAPFAPGGGVCAARGLVGRRGLVVRDFPEDRRESCRGHGPISGRG